MIVLFGHQKGGVGKSTIAINFAYLASKHFKDIALLDLDSQNSAKLFNRLRESEDRKMIRCVTKEEIDFNEMMETYANNKDNLLVIDSGGYDSDVNRAALIKADIIITPVGISQIEIFGLQLFRDILAEASDALGRNVKTNVLLNNIDVRSKSKIQELKEYIIANDKHFNLLNTQVHSRADFKHSYGEGLTVKEYKKKSDSTKEVKSLVKEIINKL